MPAADPTAAETLATVKGYLGAGLSVIRVRATGDKRAKAPVDDGWYPTYAARQPTPHEVWAWWGPDAAWRYGVGIPGGAASGNLAVLDFETAAVFAAWRAALPADTADYLDLCPVARTPGGGAHVYCRLPEPVRGCVLARRWLAAEDRPAPLVEVRGDGHQVVAPGGPLKSHDSGRPYTWEARGWLDDAGPPAALPWTVWVDWLDLAASLSEYTPPPQPRPAPRERPHEPSHDDPGSDFNRRGTWEETGLFETGWRWCREYDADTGTVTRPGKTGGVSGTLGLRSSQANGWPLFHVFTSSAVVFDADANYHKFGVYALLRHGGDFGKAALALLGKGYGRRRAGPTVGPQPGGARGSGGGGDAPDAHTPHITDSTGRTPKSRFVFEDSETFLAGDYTPQWIIPRCLVRAQPGIIGGPSKGMKTGVALDMAVSCATGTPFLGKWAVPKRWRVAFCSGESGQHTLKETCMRVLRARGLPASALSGWLKWEFNLPCFTDAVTMIDFAGHLARVEADVLIADPTYLMMGAVNASQLMEMGEVLKGVQTYLTRARPDLTVLLVHHAVKPLLAGEPMELRHISHVGFEQYARQFVLLNRRSPYQDDGEHDLWMRVGGSAGHGGLWNVHISEGVVDEDFRGRKWDVAVSTTGQAKEAVRKDREAEKRELEREEKDGNDHAVLLAIDAEMAAGQTAASLNAVRERTGYTDDRAKRTVERLLETGAVVETAPFQRKAGSSATITVKKGYRRADD